jgi:cysteinyl-tRNA synthetase
VLFAETSPAVQTIAGGGVTGMLVIVMTAFLRRTKDTDERRDEFSRAILEASEAREARAWAERDAARAELERVRQQFEQERKQWMQMPRRPRKN